MRDKPIAIMVLVLIICSLFMPLSINNKALYNISNTNRLSRYVKLTELDSEAIGKIDFLNSDRMGFDLVYDLSISDGIKNGILIFGNCARNIITGTIYDYINGFNNKTRQVKMVWVFFGPILELVRNVLVSFLDLVMMFLILLFQSTSSYLYILSYTLTVLLVLGIAKVLKE